MKLLINKIKLQKELDRHDLYLFLIYLLISLGSLYEGISFGNFFSKLTTLAFLTLFFVVYYRTLKGLYYTFWTLTFCLFVWVFVTLLTVPLVSFSFFLYSASLLIIALAAKELWTPIYYPIVSWWEYDFRYRHDVKVNVIVDGKNTEGRLTDLRLGAACVSLFKEVRVGEYLHLETDDQKSFKIEVMSKRYYSLGRPLSYGVKFELTSDDERSSYKSYTKRWRKLCKLKKKAKFSPV